MTLNTQFDFPSDSKYELFKQSARVIMKDIKDFIGWDHKYFDTHDSWYLESENDPILSYLVDRISSYVGDEDDFYLCNMIYNFFCVISGVDNGSPFVTLSHIAIDNIDDSITRSIFIAYVEEFFPKYSNSFYTDGAVRDVISNHLFSYHDLNGIYSRYIVRIQELDDDNGEDEDGQSFDDDSDDPDDYSYGEL